MVPPPPDDCTTVDGPTSRLIITDRGIREIEVPSAHFSVDGSSVEVRFGVLRDSRLLPSSGDSVSRTAPILSIGTDISPNFSASLAYVSRCLQSFDPAKRQPSLAKDIPRIYPVERLKLKLASMPAADSLSWKSFHEKESSAAENTAFLMSSRVSF